MNSPANITDESIHPRRANVAGPAGINKFKYSTTAVFLEQVVGQYLFLGAAFSHLAEDRDTIAPLNSGRIRLEVDINAQLPVFNAAGVQTGGRTGLANVVTALLLLAALFFSPLAQMAGEGVKVGGQTLYPIVAPALILVGSFMLRGVKRVDFTDPPAAIASFLTIVTMPFAFSITEGIALP